MPALKEEYLGANATIDDVLNEVYDIHYIMPRNGIHVKVELTVCEYIPLNEVDFTSGDWQLIEQGFRTLILKYDRTLKVFKLSTFNKK